MRRSAILRRPGLAILFGFAILLGSLVGCYRDPNLDKRAEVSGTVKLDGQLVENGSITFLPTGGTSGPTAGANIVNGEYHIPQVGGPVIGTNRVEFYGPKKTGRKKKDRFGEEYTEEEVVQLFPAKYNTQSKEVVEIKPGVNKDVNFDLKTH